MSPRFLDTNILLRYLTRDDPVKADSCFALLTRLEHGEEKALTSALVIFEVVFTLQRSYRVSKHEIRELITPLIDLRGLHLPEQHLLHLALDLYVEHNIAFADAYNAAYMEARGATEVYSYDREFDRVPGISRLEP